MKQIYKAINDIKIALTISNNLEVQSIVKINDTIFDDVILAELENNTRVLELDLKSGDVVLGNDNELITYTINQLGTHITVKQLN